MKLRIDHIIDIEDDLVTFVFVWGVNRTHHRTGVQNVLGFNAFGLSKTK